MICKFVVGQRVVCVIAGWCRIDGAPVSGGPVEGDVCRITGIFPCENLTYVDPLVGLELAGHEGTYDHTSFRPLQERPRETSVEVFRELLSPVRVREDA